VKGITALPREKDDVLAELAHTAHELEHEVATTKVLYERRSLLYEEAQQAGATLAEIAEMAGVTVYAVKLSMGQARKRRMA